MWQRKQTIYLIIAVLLLLLLAMLSRISFLHTSLAELSPESMGMSKYVFCQGIWDQNIHKFILGFNMSLFFLTAATLILAVIDIFLFKKRKLQMTVCRVGQLLMVIWYICFAIILYTNKDGATISIQFGSLLPFLTLVMFENAYKGIKHDDDLVKSADRIR